MSVSTGRHYLAIPGPSVVPDRVLNAIHRASSNIYEGALIEMADSVKLDLKRLAMTTGDIAAYISNGHGVWEAATANIFSRGDAALALITGQFGVFWAAAMQKQGVNVEALDFGKRSAVDPERVRRALEDDKQGRLRAVCVTHVDTSTSVRSDIAAIRRVIDDTGHPALLVVDAIASLGCDELKMDEWGIDVLLSASQKGIMLPPGLGFLWFSARARQQSDKADLVTPYWDWKPRADGEFYMRFGGTPPTQMIYGLREALTMILEEEGLTNVWARHDKLAAAVWSAFEAWGSAPGISINVEQPNSRARAVTTGKLAGGQATVLRRWLEETSGVTLGVGLGMAPPSDPAFDDYLRVAHMGHVNSHMTLGVLASMEAGMAALDIPHGAGALDAAARALR